MSLSHYCDDVCILQNSLYKKKVLAFSQNHNKQYNQSVATPINSTESSVQCF